MIISLIAAVAENNVIGRDGDMPWRLRADLKRFKSLTVGKPVIMGRKTFESLGKPLPDRLNIIMTRNVTDMLANWQKNDNVAITSTFDKALDIAREALTNLEEEEAMVIGGGEIYRQAMSHAHRLYLTHVHSSPDGDTTFPDIDISVWQKTFEDTHPQDENNSHAVTFINYERK